MRREFLSRVLQKFGFNSKRNAHLYQEQNTGASAELASVFCDNPAWVYITSSRRRIALAQRALRNCEKISSNSTTSQ